MRLTTRGLVAVAGAWLAVTLLACHQLVTAWPALAQVVGQP